LQVFIGKFCLAVQICCLFPLSYPGHRRKLIWN